MEPLIRSRLRDEIAERLATLIAAGELGTERLKEVELAGQLGVSRTPLREALLMLEREGLVVSEVNKGFRVAALIVDGELSARLKEVELADQLGVSRTPLREALLMLERE